MRCIADKQRYWRALWAQRVRVCPQMIAKGTNPLDVCDTKSSSLQGYKKRYALGMHVLAGYELMATEWYMRESWIRQSHQGYDTSMATKRKS